MRETTRLARGERRPVCEFVAVRLVLLVCGFLGAAVLAQEKAENPNIASIKPVAVVPFMRRAPRIDGVIGEGEWDTLHVSRFVSQGNDQLQPRPGEFWIGSDGKRLYVAVRSAVHPVAGVLAKFTRPPGSRDETQVVYDDSIELWFNNNPGGSEGQYYQVIVNPNGALYDMAFDLGDKIGKTYWRVDMEQAHKVEGGFWTAEFAVDLASVALSDLTKQFAMRVCRNYKLPWNQSRWAPRVIAFDAPETMPLIRFAQVAPVVSEVGFQDERGIAVAVEVSNPTDKPLPVKVKLGYNAENQPRYYKDFADELEPGEKRRYEYKLDLFSPENYAALAEILVTGADGTVFYHRDVKWQTKPKGPVWDPVGAVSAEEATRFDIEFHPTPRLLRWQAAFKNMKDKEKVKQVRLVVVNQKTRKRIAEQAVQEPKDFAVLQQLVLRKLEDGRFEAQLFLDTDEPAKAPVKTAVFDYLTDFPWLGNKIGISDEVIPPYTPLVVRGKTVSAVLRDHEMNDVGLWRQVITKGKELLAAPMSIELREDGKVTAASGKLKFRKKRPNLVIAEARWAAGRIVGTTTGEFDYDGCMRVVLEFGPRKEPARIESMRLVVPLADKMAPLMHACGDGLRFNYAGAVPAGEGVVWSSDKASRSHVLGTFLPYLFVGGEERGLCWFASSDRDWVVDLGEHVPALALERKDGVLTLYVNLVQKPATLDRVHRVVFGLQATPTRPMPQKPNWRTWGCVSGGKFDVNVLGMSGYWGAPLYTVFPFERDFTIVQKIAKARKEGQVDKEFFDAYKKKYPQVQAEVNWSAQPGHCAGVIPYTNIRGEITYTPEWVVYQNEWHRSSFPDRQTTIGKGWSVDGCTIPTPSRRDFLLYYYREILRNGFDGIYWDNIAICANENPVTSDGYFREDGSFQPGCDIWDLRALTRRTAVLTHELGKININMPHMTNAELVPVFTWTGMNLDWEWKYGATDFQDRFKREYIRACSLGLHCGNVPIILPGIINAPDKATQHWVERTRIAVCVPHEIKVWQTDPLFASLTKKMFEVGYGTEDDPSTACKVHRYWDDDPVAKVEGIDGIFIVLDGPETVLAMVSDYGNGGTARVTLDVARLGLPAEFKAVNWENPADEVRATGGTVELKDIKKHDFRVILIPKPGR